MELAEFSKHAKLCVRPRMLLVTKDVYTAFMEALISPLCMQVDCSCLVTCCLHVTCVVGVQSLPHDTGICSTSAARYVTGDD